MKICPSCHKTLADNANFCPRDGTKLHHINAYSRGFSEGMTIDNRYILKRFLGQGSFAQVWEAQHVIMKKQRALKLLCFDNIDEERIEMAVSRFFREVEAIASLGHENIVKVFEFGEDREGKPYLVMEYLDGVSLFDYVFETEFPIDTKVVLNYVRQIADGMNEAHENGIVHRDLKSENIFISRNHGRDIIKILDFGVAKFMHNNTLANISHCQIFGSPGYMAPEQARGLDLDGRTDIYALGVILFEIFTKELPFTGNTTEVLLAQVQKNCPDPRDINPYIPEAVVSTIYKAMSKDPKKRFQTMNEVSLRLREIIRNL
jgi:eukaryotic-like serine/threonine-protein kinase